MPAGFALDVFVLHWALSAGVVMPVAVVVAAMLPFLLVVHSRSRATAGQ